jgi:hypothetical protein
MVWNTTCEMVDDPFRDQEAALASVDGFDGLGSAPRPRPEVVVVSGIPLPARRAEGRRLREDPAYAG